QHFHLPKVHIFHRCLLQSIQNYCLWKGIRLPQYLKFHYQPTLNYLQIFRLPHKNLEEPEMFEIMDLALWLLQEELVRKSYKEKNLRQTPNNPVIYLRLPEK